MSNLGNTLILYKKKVEQRRPRISFNVDIFLYENKINEIFFHQGVELRLRREQPIYKVPEINRIKVKIS